MSELLAKIHSEEMKMLRELDRVCGELGVTYFLSCGTLLGAVRHKGFIPWDEDLDVMMPRKDYDIFIEKAPELLSDEIRLDDFSTNPLYFNPFAKLRLKNTAFEIRSLRDYKGGQEMWLDIFPMDDAPDKDSPELRKRAAKIGVCRCAICAKRGIFDKTTVSSKQRAAISLMKLLPDRVLINALRKAHVGDKVRTDDRSAELNDCSPNYVIFGTDYDYKKLVMPKKWFLPAVKIAFENGEYSAPADSDKVLTHIYGDYMKLPPKEKQVTFYPERIVFSDGEEVKINEGERP